LPRPSGFLSSSFTQAKIESSQEPPKQTPPQLINTINISPELSSNQVEQEREDAKARGQTWVGEFFQAKEQGTEVEL
jgi:hypothetical protein